MPEVRCHLRLFKAMQSQGCKSWGTQSLLEQFRYQGAASDDIDQAITVAAYHWWLEPGKNESGKPIAETVPFVIRLD